MQRIILDASALIAVIYEEKGANIVEKHLSRAVISTINLAEVATFMTTQGFVINEAELLLKNLALEIIEYTTQHAFLTAALRPKTQTKGLSLGDRACLAVALTEKLPVLTADKIWSKLDLGISIQLIR